ncbi:LOW QUALITY PROTEIN: low density lipoprotein receptor adapter protein 1, partial [Parus major]|uniref:LOW QUALITY PROTEIN: low density lipoprotein receptor adapter protein 1 n=1 Tax=Parus major TaxID=9157 RepID=UPI0014443C86
IQPFLVSPELPENWTDTRETLLEGMLFSLKYLGMTLVEQPKGEELSAAAVKRIVATAKASGKKLQKVTLKVSPRGIVLNDSRTNELIENISIYRISYCTADKSHDKVFAYIAQNQLNENLECHAFLCTKRKMQQPRGTCWIWRVLPGPPWAAARSHHSWTTAALGPAPDNNNVLWEMDDGLDEAFSRLAQSRTNPQVLDTGLTAQDIQSAETLSPVDWNKIDPGTAEKDDLFMF